jgi:hypothetical protein
LYTTDCTEHPKKLLEPEHRSKPTQPNIVIIIIIIIIELPPKHFASYFIDGFSSILIHLRLLSSRHTASMNWFSASTSSDYVSNVSEHGIARVEVNDTASIHSNETRNTVDADMELAKELHQLSFQDRTKVQEEVHGVNFALAEETLETIDTSLKQLRDEVTLISSKEAYDFALRSLDPSYIQSSEFQLRFLRASLFNARQAAVRYTKYLDLLFEFFGNQGLQRPLRYSDLSKVEKDCLKEGRRQILPSRDRSGRLIMFEKGSMSTESRMTRVRIRLFLNIPDRRVR